MLLASVLKRSQSVVYDEMAFLILPGTWPIARAEK